MDELIQIWATFIQARQQLVERQFIRTFNNPIEDFSEFLVALATNGQLANNVNQRDYDVESGDRFIQVKSIAKAPNNPNGYIVTTKDRENQLATHYAFVLFDNYLPVDIYIVDADWVRDYPRSQIKRQNLVEVCGERDINFPNISVRYQQP